MMMHNPPRVDDVRKKRIAQLGKAIQVGVEQLHNNQSINGQLSRENMKRKSNRS